jgi:hypothetical protein
MFTKNKNRKNKDAYFAGRPTYGWQGYVRGRCSFKTRKIKLISSVNDMPAL